MKTVDEIKKELQSIENDIKNKLNLFIRENPNISVNMDFSTSKTYFESLGIKSTEIKEIESELIITID